jgi:molybdenum ABC transporter molybdate-binding protein
MKNKFLLIFLLSFFCFGNNSFATPSRNITIFAEPNMAIPLAKIARLFSQQSNVIVALNFNPANDLINDIDSGEPADVFISAHSGLLFNLRQKGVIDVHNIGYVARDNLVLVTVEDSEGVPSALSEKKLTLEQSLKVLDRNRAILMIDNVSNSSGKFSQSFLAQARLPNLKIVKKEDRGAIFNILKSEKNRYALLLASQIYNQKNLQVLAEKKDVNIFYEALVIAGDNMEVGREFLKFMKSDLAKKILQESGFLTD